MRVARSALTVAERRQNQIAGLAREKQLAAITISCDYAGEQIELVDVTDDLVKLYDPSERTLKTVRELRKIKPARLTEIAVLPATE
mgnify:CR=1 FL=1